MTDYEPGSQWRQRLLWPDELLHQIQHADGLDPDGPRLVPMQPRLSQEDARRELRRFREVADRDAMLRRAIGFL